MEYGYTLLIEDLNQLIVICPIVDLIDQKQLRNELMEHTISG